MTEPRPIDGSSDGETRPTRDDTSTVYEAPSSPSAPSGGARRGGARYAVLEELGRGAMGRVLRAYDPRLQREVALKEVHGGALDELATARLVVEARAMAKLSHPHVVAVYDVEEVGPREVVVVMEYVRGSTLQAWLSEERGWRAVVSTLVQAGRGLAAAHAVGLLHRDFKPANVLVSDGGVAKVGDFGLAKTTELESVSPESGVGDPAAVANDMTDAGVVMGTPRYMAPEQHLGEALTPAADQYALCVTSWEALCGAPPFSGPSMGELVRQKQAGPPAWPKASVPRPIGEAIVRGLSPRPEDRWPSIAELLEVLACDPSRRRNRWWRGLGVVAGLGLLGAAWVSWRRAEVAPCSGAEQRLRGHWDDERREAVKTAVLGINRAYAATTWSRAERELDAYARAWVAMHTEACEATTVRGEQSSEVMDLRMVCLHRAAVELGAAVSVLASADEQAVQNAHELLDGLRPLSRCADVEALVEDVEPPLPEEAEAVERARARMAEAEAADRAGRYPEAKRAIDAAHAELEGIRYGPVRSELAVIEGDVLEALGEYGAAEAAWSDALALATRWRQWNELWAVTIRLADVLGERAQGLDDAERYAAMAAALADGDPSREASVASLRGKLFKQQERHEDAEAEYRKALALREQALGPSHPGVASSRSRLATVLRREGKLEEAEAEHRKALAQWEQALGAEHPVVATARNNLANTLEDRGRYEEAEAEHRKALALREQALGAEHPLVAASRNRLADVLLERGRPAEALELAELVWQQRTREDTPPELRARAALLLAETLWQSREDPASRARARALAEQALAELEPTASAREQDASEVHAWLDEHRDP